MDGLTKYKSFLIFISRIRCYTFVRFLWGMKEIFRTVKICISFLNYERIVTIWISSEIVINDELIFYNVIEIMNGNFRKIEVKNEYLQFMFLVDYLLIISNKNL
jgi:hypothetical protein